MQTFLEIVTGTSVSSFQLTVPTSRPSYSTCGSRTLHCFCTAARGRGGSDGNESQLFPKFHSLKGLFCTAHPHGYGTTRASKREAAGAGGAPVGAAQGMPAARGSFIKRSPSRALAWRAESSQPGCPFAGQVQ